jgi:hypothetical protein
MRLLNEEQRADIIVISPQGQPVLVVEVKRRPLDTVAFEQLSAYSRVIKPQFVMAVDPQHIRIATTSSGIPDWKSGVTLSTPDILRRYTNAPDLRNVERFYLESLIEGWLRDFSFFWKSEQPPGYLELDRIGLSSRLRGTETQVKR